MIHVCVYLCMCMGKVIEQNSMGVKYPVNICTSLYIIYVQNQHDMKSPGSIS